MNRNDYLNLCRACAMIKTRGMFNMALSVPDGLRVVYNNIEYYPEAYELSFDNTGDTIHLAILHDLKRNAITRASLERVQQKEGT